ncbi:dehydrogenase/reductase SDR family member on chromosome X-like [Dipodomys spectabilis]|uniref:dehydrogenase/reductase SDR family member on chromosome X-like n=1 Tax=Dipodomys spectabilis TaxID=105255 RepID=UPI001C534C11|nr:dehydrogenase/reductase SDR family member on chromosome X-like [Dipodomys spectabilis]
MWLRLWAALRVYALGLAELAAQLLRPRGGRREPALPPQPGRVAIVTGGTDGLGLAAARELARLRMRVLLAGNNTSRAEAAVRDVREYSGNDQVEFMYLDLGSQHSVREFVREFKAKQIPLHVLVNNAGVMMVPRRLTPDGLEEHFAVNYLGHFLLTMLLLDLLRASGTPGRTARVVNVTSATHHLGYICMEDLQGSRAYSPHAAYAQSKLALLLFTFRLQRVLSAGEDEEEEEEEEEEGAGRHDAPLVTVNAVDPGVVDTGLYRHLWWGPRLVQRLLGRWAFKAPWEAARLLALAAADPALEARGGRLLRMRGAGGGGAEEARAHARARDVALQRALWARSRRLARA